MKNKLRNISYAALTGTVFLIYLQTIAPSVIQIDSGELAAVQSLPGIAHPSGYPLFSLFGYLFSLIPLGISKIFQLNLLAAVFTAMAVLVFYKINLLIWDNTDYFMSNRKRKEAKSKKVLKNKKIKKVTSEPITKEINSISISANEKIIFSFLGALILAFSSTFWFQSVSVEVYSLHVLMLTLILFALIKAYVSKDNTKIAWFTFAAFLSLGFSNHLTTLLLLPATAYLYFNRNKFNKSSFILLAEMIGLFLIILVPLYSYFPIVASTNPYLNWGNPIDMERILRHISGKQYQVWIFSSFDSAKKQLIYFITNLPKEFAASLILIAAGVIFTFMKTRKLFYLLMILFISTLFYSVNYDIVDIDAYFLLAYISLSMWGIWGIYFLYNKFATDPRSRYVIIAIVALIIFLQGYLNFPGVNQNGNYIFEDYTKMSLASVENNSVIFSYQWDYLISPAYYFQFVENYRKDVAIIDKELLRRSWYYNQMKTNYPEVVSGISDLESEFLRAIKPFERDEEFNSNLLESLYRQIMTRLVESNYQKRSYYIGAELVINEMSRNEFTLPQGLKLVPHLFFFKVAEDDSYQPAGDFNYKFRKTPVSNSYTSFIKDMVPNMLVRRAIYEMQFEKQERAKHYLTAIKENFPEFRISPDLEEILKRK
ncbi:MAG: DUF2723 domain-containing protein [Ignavibacteriaceae bacterium]